MSDGDTSRSSGSFRILVFAGQSSFWRVLASALSLSAHREIPDVGGKARRGGSDGGRGGGRQQEGLDSPGHGGTTHAALAARQGRQVPKSDAVGDYWVPSYLVGDMVDFAP